MTLSAEMLWQLADVLGRAEVYYAEALAKACRDEAARLSSAPTAEGGEQEDAPLCPHGWPQGAPCVRCRLGLASPAAPTSSGASRTETPEYECRKGGCITPELCRSLGHCPPLTGEWVWLHVGPGISELPIKEQCRVWLPLNRDLGSGVVAHRVGVGEPNAMATEARRVAEAIRDRSKWGAELLELMADRLCTLTAEIDQVKRERDHKHKLFIELSGEFDLLSDVLDDGSDSTLLTLVHQLKEAKEALTADRSALQERVRELEGERDEARLDASLHLITIKERDTEIDAAESKLARAREALTKISDENYSVKDGAAFHDQPIMIWQAAAREALASLSTPASEGEQTT